MSNLEVEPKELVCEADPVPGDQVTLLEPRLVPLGGPRAMTVRRTLTRRGRSLIGAWCFAENYGPDDVAASGGMAVPPHPHPGLQTVSWLFAGEIEHRDSTGAHAMVRPGELNLMTAGSGIQHSEVSVVSTLREHQGSPGSTREHRSTREGDGILHGVQLWTALPDASRHTAPHFEHFVPEVFEHQGANTSVFLGSLLGHESTATAFMPIIGAQFDLPANTEITIPVDVAFEHGGLADAGDVTVDGVTVPLANIGYRAVGARALTITSGDAAARVLLLGGEPFAEQIVMWWNFVGRSHDEIVSFRERWQGELIARTTPTGQFGLVRGYDGSALPAPELPSVRLKPRR